MKTSATIKQAQYHPIKGKSLGDGRWEFPSKSRQNVSYMVVRNGRNYLCGCQASRARFLCSHIVWAVMDDAKEKFNIVQIWTNEQDAKRQKRATIQMWARGTAFWVTYASSKAKLLQLEIEKIDQEIDQMGREIAQARHNRFMTGDGQIRADNLSIIRKLEPELLNLMRQRASLVGRKYR